MLRALSGKTHNVFTGVSIQNIEKKITHSMKEQGDAKKLTDEDVFYLKNHKPYDSQEAMVFKDTFLYL